MTSLSVLGAGAFGTALAISLAEKWDFIELWARDGRLVRDIEQSRENRRRLPGIRLPRSLRATEKLPKTEVTLLAIPMQELGAFLEENSHTLDGSALVACCKGIDLSSGLGPSGLIKRECPNSGLAVLTGPSFAADIAIGLPTALTLACEDPELGRQLQSSLSTSALRLYLSNDPLGAELGGALKNVVALAAGLTIGAELGESARAAVVSRGFAEMQRIALALGARPETLMGLSGLGDLILTCSSEKSRNFNAGLRIARRLPLEQDTTIEGLATAKAIAKMAARLGLDAPLSSIVGAVVEGELSVDEARDQLMSRPLKEE